MVWTTIGQLRHRAGGSIENGCVHRPRFWVRVCCGLLVSMQTKAGAGPLEWLRLQAWGSSYLGKQRAHNPLSHAASVQTICDN